MPKVQDDMTVHVSEITDLDAYKARLFAVAREEAHARGWCEVVDDILANRLGLGEYYPDSLTVQIKHGEYGSWNTYANFSDDDGLDYAIRQTQNYWTNTKRYNGAPVQSGSYAHHIEPDTDLAEVLQKMQAFQASIGKAKPDEEIYPQYRLVRISRGALEPKEIIWDCLEERRSEIIAMLDDAEQTPAESVPAF